MLSKEVASLKNLPMNIKIDRLLYGEWPSRRLLVMSALEGMTDYEDGLVARTSRHPLGISITMPGDCFLEFSSESAAGDDVLFSSDFFLCGNSGSRVRGVILDAHHLLIEGDGISCREGSGLVTVARKDKRWLIGATVNFRPELIDADFEGLLQTRAAWLENLDFPEFDSQREVRTLFTALSIMKGQICSASGAIPCRWSTPDRWPHRNMWLWDSAFHAIGWRHLDASLSKEMLDAILAVQRGDGFIPLSASPRGAESEFTQPPILAYGVKKVYEVSPDVSWVESVYPKLAAYVKWDLQHRDLDGGGLCEWKIEESLICRSGESGMDNSPRFDQAVPLDAVDFNSFLAMECETLAEFANTLGKHEESAEWRALHANLCRLINERLWSDEQEFYCDFDAATQQHSPILSSCGFLPLLCGAVPKEKVGILLRHLQDPKMFGTEFPVPSISAKNHQAYSKDMWRGPTWININWLIAQGLERYGLKEESKKLLARTRTEIETWCEEFGTLFEYYDDRREVTPPELMRKGSCSPQVSPYFQVFHDYGWTACLYVDSLLTQSKDHNAPETLHTV